MIEVKTHFHGWKKVDKEAAIRWVQHFLKHSIYPDKKKYEYLNKNKLRGITVEELLEQ